MNSTPTTHHTSRRSGRLTARRIVRPLTAALGTALLAASCAAAPTTTATPLEAPTTAPAVAPTTAAPTTAAPTTAAPTTAAPTTAAPTTAAPTTTVPVQDPAVGAILAGYTTWQETPRHWADGRALSTQKWHAVESNVRREITCAPSALPTVTRSFEEFPAFGFSGDDIVPGLVVDGDVVESGDVRVVPLERAPLTLRSSLASSDPLRTVEEPDSGTLSVAVAELKRDADPRLGNIDVASSDIEYSRSETHSFEQNALELGVSLRYRNPMVQAGMEANYHQESETEKHSITVRMVQRLLTVSMVDDAITGPGDYFSVDTNADQVNALIASGVVGAANPPMVIDRVDYGRVMYFTMTSSRVSSAQELQVAMDAVSRRYQGEGSVEASHLATINSSEISLIAYGGDQSLALDAIRSGDINRFFGPANTATAAPLAFAMRTLDGDLVQISDSADVNQLTCGRTVDPYSFSIEVSDVQGTLKVYVDSARELTVRDDNGLIQKRDGSGSLDLDQATADGEYDIRLRYTNLGCDNQFTVRIIREDGEVFKTSHPTPGCFGEGDMTVDLVVNTHTGEVKEV